MLPLPPIRIRRIRSMRDWIKQVDAYTLWAINPQPPLVPRRPADRSVTLAPPAHSPQAEPVHADDRATA